MENAILGAGLIAIGASIFAESGILAGFFLPGDTLLLGAGILASQHVLPLGWLLIVISIAAVAGDNVGYQIGKHAGKRIFKKKDSLLFSHEHLQKAEDFYEVHGGKTIVLARFVPLVRTFAPVVAGAGNMPRSRFMFFNVIGAVIWAIGLTLAGYWFGSRMPWLKNYISKAVIAMALLSFGFAILNLLREKRLRQLIWQKLRRR